MSSPARRRSPERKRRSQSRSPVRRSPSRRRSPVRRNQRDAILNNTDLMFLLSDYLDDETAVELFNAKKSYRKMIDNFPGRYKKKKQVLLRILESEIERLNGRVIKAYMDRLLVEFDFGKYVIGIKSNKNSMDIIEVYHGPKKHAFMKDRALINALKDYIDTAMP